jgi:hypothetical protein
MWLVTAATLVGTLASAGVLHHPVIRGWLA